jgi:site-specific recombinase XerD
MKKFPKLSDQDDFLLSLQNNNYSLQTIYNYARDLCIFATFLHFRGTKFNDVSKKDIDTFKGYLVAGKHLKDLDRFRNKYAENIDISGTKDSEALSDDLSDVKFVGGMNRPKTEDENEVKPTKRFESDFLTDVYAKVYGNLGKFSDSSKSSKISSKKSAGLSPRSINRMLSSLRSFLKFKISYDLDIPLPPDAVNLMKAEKKTKKVASLEQLKKLIEAPMLFEKDEKVALRNRCMLEMLFATGMRISELIDLDLEQLNVEGKIYILGKGKKERSAYMTSRSLDWLNKYLVVRLRYAFLDRDESEQPAEMEKFFVENSKEKGRETPTTSELNLEIFDKGNRKYIKLIENYRKSGMLNKFDSPALFIPFSGSRSGKPNARISTNYFQERIVVYRKKIGIQIPTSAHSLRHGFATYLAQEGANPAALQVLLGHESLNTTTKYVHASEKFAEETVRKNHPLK